MRKRVLTVKSMERIKQVMVVRKDLHMGVGKTAAQVAHASLMSYLKTTEKHEEIAEEWMKTGETKVVLKVNSEDDFVQLKKDLKRSDLPFVVVRDAGQTQVEPGSETVIGIGPYYIRGIDKLTGKLSLL